MPHELPDPGLVIGARRGARTRSDRGQVVAAIPLVGALVAVVVLVLLRSSEASVTVARADTAADAVALAVAAAGDPAGHRVAQRHGSSIVSIHHRGTLVSVVVEVDGVRAAATAERVESWVAGVPSG